MLAEGVDSSFEELVGILTDQEPEKGTSTETSSTKTSPRKPSQRQSVIAQIWRKPSFAGGNDGSHTERYPLNALEKNPLETDLQKPYLPKLWSQFRPECSCHAVSCSTLNGSPEKGFLNRHFLMSLALLTCSIFPERFSSNKHTSHNDKSRCSKLCFFNSVKERMLAG